MIYKTTLSHEDFVLILDTLKKTEEQGLISWDATQVICENTTIVY